MIPIACSNLADITGSHTTLDPIERFQGLVLGSFCLMLVRVASLYRYIPATLLIFAEIINKVKSPFALRHVFSFKSHSKDQILPSYTAPHFSLSFFFFSKLYTNSPRKHVYKLSQMTLFWIETSKNNLRLPYDARRTGSQCNKPAAAFVSPLTCSE